MMTRRADEVWIGLRDRQPSLNVMPLNQSRFLSVVCCVVLDCFVLSVLVRSFVRFVLLF